MEAGDCGPSSHGEGIKTPSHPCSSNGGVSDLGSQDPNPNSDSDMRARVVPFPTLVFVCPIPFACSDSV